MISSVLISAGTLFISLDRPLQFPQGSDPIWISDSKILQADAIGPRWILKGLKIGTAYISSSTLIRPQNKSTEVPTNESRSPLAPGPLRVQVLEDADWILLQKCRQQEFYDLQKFPFRLRRFPENPCKFKKLSANPEEQAQIPTQQLESQLKNLGFRYSLARWSPEGIRILEMPQSQASMESKIFRSLGLWASFYNFKWIAHAQPGKTLIFLMTLFEFSKTKAQSLGVTWPQGFRLLPLEGHLKNWQSQSSKEIGFDFGESAGVGKVIAQPQIRTRPGDPARFQNGGELAIKTHSDSSSQVNWKPYGLMIEIQVDANTPIGAQEISMEFKLEVSEPDFANAIEGIPAMNTRKLESKFDLRVEEHTVLSTLIQSRQGKQQDGLYGLSSLPLIDKLFSKQDQQQYDTELWIALRPSWEELSIPEISKGL